MTWTPPWDEHAADEIRARRRRGAAAADRWDSEDAELPLPPSLQDTGVPDDRNSRLDDSDRWYRPQDSRPGDGEDRDRRRGDGGSEPPSGRRLAWDADGPRKRRPGEERVIWSGHPHWHALIVPYLKAYGVLAVLVAFGVALARMGAVSLSLVIGAGLVLAIGIWFIGRKIRHATVYRITSRRVVKRWGIVSKREEEARLAAVRNVTVTISIWERLLGIGNINFDTAGEGYGELARGGRGSRGPEDLTVFWGVRRPFRVREIIQHDEDFDASY